MADALKKTRATPARKKTLPVAVSSDNPRHMSVNQLSQILGRDRGTISRWIEKHKCPVVQRADKASGLDWILDISEVVKWREQQIAKEALQQRVDEGEDAYDDPKEMVRLAQLQLKLEESRKELVRQRFAVAVLQRAFALVRQAVMALPNRFMDLLVGVDPDKHRQIYSQSVELCIDALEDAARTIKDFDTESRAPEAPSSWVDWSELDGGDDATA